MPKNYKHYGEWLGRSSKEYEMEIRKLKTEIEILNSKMKQQPTLPKWTDTVWEQCAHELVWAIGLIEENPTSPKAWRKMFNVLKTYENLTRTNKTP